ncbi:MAG: MBL fold metallo-hydrolase [Candidatus Sericytochromatia bacterium]
MFGAAALGNQERLETRRFQRVQGSTSWMPLGHANVGLYVHKKRGVLIDSGYTEEDAQWIGDLLESEVIRLEAILHTHAHPDSSGGSSFLKKRFGCKIYVSQGQRNILEHPNRSNYIAMVQAAVDKEREETERARMRAASAADDDEAVDASLLEETPHRKAVIEPKPCPADGILDPRKPFVMSTGKAFTMMDLSGHVNGQMGIITPDQVFFIGDALYTFDELAEKPIPYLESAEQFKKTLEALLQTPYSKFVPSHGKPLEFSIANEVLFHKRQLEMLEQAILLHLQMPHTKEELVALLFATFGIEENIPNFYMMTATIMTFLNALKRNQQVRVIHEDGKTRWFARQK